MIAFAFVCGDVTISSTMSGHNAAAGPSKKGGTEKQTANIGKKRKYYPLHLHAQPSYIERFDQSGTTSMLHGVSGLVAIDKTWPIL